MRAVENDFDGTRMTIPRARDATGQGGDGGAFVRVHAGHGQATFCAGAHRTWSGPLHQRAGAAHAQDADGRWSRRCEDGEARKSAAHAQDADGHARTHAHTHTLSPPSMGVLASSYIFSVPTAISLLNPLPPCTCEHTHVHLCKHSDLFEVAAHVRAHARTHAHTHTLSPRAWVCWRLLTSSLSLLPYPS